MPLDGTRLHNSIKADLVTQLNSLFPIPPGLQPAEVTAFNASRQNAAEVIAEAVGPDVVAEITGHALETGSVTSGPGAGGATTGTIS